MAFRDGIDRAESSPFSSSDAASPPFTDPQGGRSALAEADAGSHGRRHPFGPPRFFLFDRTDRLGTAAGLVALMLPTLFLVIAVHECGHALAGRAAGYRLLALIVGPVAIGRANGRTQFEMNPSWSFAGGIALLVPHAPGLPSRRAAIALYAGGPLASILLAAAAFALRSWSELDEVRFLTVLEGEHTQWQLLASNGLRLVGLQSAGIALGTLFPQRIGGFTSDGSAILTHLRGGAASARFRAASSLLGRAAAGTRPREWSLEELRAADDANDASDASGHASLGSSFVFAAEMDRGNLAAAREALARMLASAAKTPSVARGELHAAESFIAAIDGDPTAARSAFARLDPTYSEPPTMARVEAAVLLAEGRVEEARATAERGLASLAASPMLVPGYAAPERDWLEALAAGRMPLRPPAEDAAPTTERG
jgi:hypothetical protein